MKPSKTLKRIIPGENEYKPVACGEDKQGIKDDVQCLILTKLRKNKIDYTIDDTSWKPWSCFSYVAVTLENSDKNDHTFLGYKLKTTIILSICDADC